MGGLEVNAVVRTGAGEGLAEFDEVESVDEEYVICCDAEVSDALEFSHSPVYVVFDPTRALVTAVHT